MNKYVKTWIYILILLFIFTISVFAHPGSLDDNGGHWDRSNGTYHFHEGKNTTGFSLYDPDYEYPNKNFEPPYEPPTNNPYKNSDEEAKNELSTVELIIPIIILFPFIVGAIRLIVLLIIEIIRPIVSFICEVVYLLFKTIFIELLYSSLLKKYLPKHNIEIFKTKLNEYNRCKEELLDTRENVMNRILNLHIPQGCSVGDDGLPKSTKLGKGIHSL